MPIPAMRLIKTVANEVVELPLLPHEASEVKDFVAKLDSALKEVSDAALISKDVGGKLGELQEELESRSIWGQAKAVISGKNDKDLATMIERLGVSLQLTQNAVKVLFAVQTQKHRMLHQFHKVLVDKISLVTADTQTLNESQRKSVLVFLSELQHQVDEQLLMQEKVESHSKLLQRHEDTQKEFSDDLQQLHSDLTFFSEEQKNQAQKSEKAKEELHKQLQEDKKQQQDDIREQLREVTALLRKEISEQLGNLEKQQQENLQAAEKNLSRIYGQGIQDLSLQHQEYKSSMAQQLTQLQRLNETQLKEISQLEAQIKTLQSEQLKRSRSSLLMSILCSVLVSVAVGAAFWFLR